jgi:hypothetical protein
MINMGRRLVIAVSLVSIMLKNNDLIFSTVGFLVATLKHYSLLAQTQTWLLCSISRSRLFVDVCLLHIFVGVKAIQEAFAMQTNGWTFYKHTIA